MASIVPQKVGPRGIDPNLTELDQGDNLVELSQTQANYISLYVQNRSGLDGATSGPRNARIDLPSGVSVVEPGLEASSIEFSLDQHEVFFLKIRVEAVTQYFQNNDDGPIIDNYNNWADIFAYATYFAWQ